LEHGIAQITAASRLVLSMCLGGPAATAAAAALLQVRLGCFFGNTGCTVVMTVGCYQAAAAAAAAAAALLQAKAVAARSGYFCLHCYACYVCTTATAAAKSLHGQRQQQ
jgi:hypothetical protein